MAGSPKYLEIVKPRRVLCFFRSGFSMADLEEAFLEDVVFGFVIAVEGASADASLVDNVLNTDLRVGPALFNKA